MGKLVFGMMQSLDGYVDGVSGQLELPPPGVALGRHFTDHVRGLAGVLYGRRMYEIMRCWDEDQPEWDADEHDFAAAWRAKPKWVVSRTLKSVGGNATLARDNVDALVRRPKQDVEGEVDVAGPALAASLTSLGLVDEYHLCFRPFVLGGGKPYFAGAPATAFASSPAIVSARTRFGWRASQPEHAESEAADPSLGNHSYVSNRPAPNVRCGSRACLLMARCAVLHVTRLRMNPGVGPRRHHPHPDGQPAPRARAGATRTAHSPRAKQIPLVITWTRSDSAGAH